MTPMGFEVSEYTTADFTAAQIEAIARLEMASFSKKRSLEERIERISKFNSEPGSKRFVIWEQATPTASARTFHRTIFVGDQELTILALASVCSDPEYRGRGLGSMVVRAAFKEVDNGTCPASLFQTGVPLFYEKLNCRLIDNEIVNRQSPEGAPPFFEADVMIYPAEFNWPAGTVDLNGEGY